MLLDSDTQIEISVYQDTELNDDGSAAGGMSIVEAYFMGGRVAMTLPGLSGESTKQARGWGVGIAASASRPVRLANATSWRLSGIMVGVDTVVRGGAAAAAAAGSSALRRRRPGPSRD